MVDNILQSNSTSVVLRSLVDSKMEDMSYFIAPSFPLMARQDVELLSDQGTITSPAGQEVSFRLNKSMIIRGMKIKTEYVVTQTTGENVEQACGLDMFRQVQWRSNNKIIMTNSDGYILVRSQHAPVDECMQAYRTAYGLGQTTLKGNGTTSANKVCFTPIFSSFFDNYYSGLDLGFYEQQSIHAFFNTQTAGGFPNAISSATCKLICDTWVPDLKAYNMLRSMNQNPSKPLNMLTRNSFTELVELTSTTSTTIKLNANFPVEATYFFIRNKAGGVQTASTRCKPIESFTFDVGGVTLLSSLTPYVGSTKNDLVVIPTGIIPLNAEDAYPTEVELLQYGAIKLNWGLLAHDSSRVSGALSFNSLNSPQLTVNYSTLTAADHELVVVHQYWNLLTLDASNASINITANN